MIVALLLCSSSFSACVVIGDICSDIAGWKHGARSENLDAREA